VQPLFDDAVIEIVLAERADKDGDRDHQKLECK
jgi:hypothetical protein